jgi:hypothetical protein
MEVCGISYLSSRESGSVHALRQKCKVAVPQKRRACVLAVARKPTRSQTRTRKPWVPPEDAARLVPTFVSGGHPPRAGGRPPPPISGDRTNPNRKTVGAAHTRVGAVCPQTPERFSNSAMMPATGTAPMSRGEAYLASQGEVFCR